MKKRIYFDNASTSFPKADGVGKMMGDFICDNGMNINRGVYSASFDAANVVLDTRERLRALFNATRARNVIFTANVTQSLNMLIKGMLKPGDHVLVTPFEHNATMRPLVQMEKLGVRFSRMSVKPCGALDLDAAERLICAETRAIFALHASNVSGQIMPARELGQIAAARGLFFILDAAQTAGFIDVDMQDLHADAVAFTGHKGLLGPQGIGGFALTDRLSAALEPLLSGGTGSFSDSEDVPGELPDRFEAGTMNVPGIFGLNAALKYLEKTGIAAIRAKERELAGMLDNVVRKLPGARVLGSEDINERTAIVSVDFAAHDNAEIAFRLDDEYGIMTRCGLHCAPNAHRTYGTFPQGTVRFSPGHFCTNADVEYCIDALKKILAD